MALKITFLGTGAANAYPEAFCRCDHCSRARQLGGPSLRARSAALVNEDLLIDLGPDIHTAAMRLQVSLENVCHCLQTHAHTDHLDPSHLLSRSPGYGVVGAPRLEFYASPATLAETARLLARDTAPGTLFDDPVAAQLNLRLHPVAPLQPFRVGLYRVVAFPAVHDPQVEPYLYAVSDHDHSIFYATDTAAWPEEFWEVILRFGLRFDLVVLDHTYGPGEPGRDHLSAHQVSEYAARFRDEGLLLPGGRVLGTHIAHEGNPPYPDLAAYAARQGYEIAYDGLVVELGG